MTISGAPYLDDDRSLMVGGRTVLTGVPPNVVVTPSASGSAFLGAAAPGRSHSHVFSLGLLEGFRWLCLFRFKIWWMIPRFGKSASDIPLETQMLLLEAKESSAVEDDPMESEASGNTLYILLLPVLDGDFRASLQGSSSNELQFCLESGDPNVQTSQALEAVFINSCENPFDLIRDSIKFLAKHKGTFNHVENKKIPANLDWFGWCTWDAFYTDVNPEGVIEGLQSLSEGGTPARFLIIDDGWQDTTNEFCKDGEPFIEGTQFATRLVDIKENNKFKNNDKCKDLSNFIRIIKEKYNLKTVYMWHALVGYWGGVLTTSESMKKYNPKLEYPVQSPGVSGNVWDIALDSLVKYGVGMIDPDKIYEFYNDLHGYLSSCGVDGVKVDAQTLLETLGSGYGGRVSATRKYQQSLEASINRHFKDNNLICCMCHNSDSFYSSLKGAVARCSEDFMPNEPALHPLHIASVSFNSLLLGEILKPDWDMFHSKNPAANFHAAARAIGGCGIYVSDKPGKHDFHVLKKLVLPDGSVLRSKFACRPTRDSLFNDPVMDGKSLLKIWNQNNFSGVIGVFNCQGLGTWPPKEIFNNPGTQSWLLKEWPTSSAKSSTISGHVSPSHIEYLEDLAGESWTGDCALYAFSSGSLTRASMCGKLDVSLATLQYEIYTVSPIREYDQRVQFAPIGLVNMFNSGGAVEDITSINYQLDYTIKIKSRSPGQFGAYSSIKPKHCLVDAEEKEFDYNSRTGFLTLELPSLPNESKFRDLKIIY